MDDISDRLPAVALEPADPEWLALLDRAMQESAADLEPVTDAYGQATPEVQDRERVPWPGIRGDDEADWALARLADIDWEIADAEAYADRMRERIDEWLSQRIHARRGQYPSLVDQRGFFTSHLAVYALDQREAKGRKTVALINGEIATTERKPEVTIVDDEALMSWAEDNLPDVIRTRYDILVTNLRRFVKPTPGGGLLLTDADPDEDGPARPDVVVDAIPGVTLTESTVTAKVTVKR